MTARAPLPPALVAALAGTYELLQEIGRGGMGIVYAGRDVRLDRLVAIKVLPELVGSDIVRERFLREARAAARLSHPSIVPIYSADDRGGVTFLVMAYVDGTTLTSRLHGGHPLTPADAVPILRDVALALGAAHARGVIHRDIKPENILIDRVTGRAMVTDFGIARLADALQAGALTRTGQVLGTVGYMSPEHVTGAEVDGRSDLYSLGVVAFEALSGQLPFDGPAPVVIVAHATRPPPPLAAVATHVPTALCAVVDRCLRKNPADRFETGAALAAALEEAVGNAVAHAPSRLGETDESRTLTEAEAERVWKRAAELQAGFGSSAPARAPTAAMTMVPRDATSGFRLEHVRLAALEAGISAPYVTLALDELLRRAEAGPPGGFRDAGMARRSSGPIRVQDVRSLSPPVAPLAGAPMSAVYEVEIVGQLSPTEFDMIAQTIRNTMGEAGIATALGRTFTWSPGGDPDSNRSMHISVTAAGGKTQIRAEEKFDRPAGWIFGGIVGGGSAVLGVGGFGLGMAAFESHLAAAACAGSLAVSTYFVARAIFKRMTRSRATGLEDLVARLGAQVTDLVAAADEGQSSPRSNAIRR